MISDVKFVQGTYARKNKTLDCVIRLVQLTSNAKVCTFNLLFFEGYQNRFPICLDFLSVVYIGE